MNLRPELQIQRQILRDLGSHPDIRLFVNPSGEGWAGRLLSYEEGVCRLQAASRVTYGLAPGSADLIGLRRVIITPADVGRTVAVFLSLEVKTPTGRPSGEQIQWDGFVRRFGGLSGIVRSVDESRLVAGV